MFDKIKKTLGRRKPLGDIPVPNGTLPVAIPAIPDKSSLKGQFDNVLNDPVVLEKHYKDMLSSRGTSQFAKDQMGQLKESTKRELVRMWLMSPTDLNLKEATIDTPLPELSKSPCSPNRKRAHSDTSAVGSPEDDLKRQKTGIGMVIFHDGEKGVTDASFGSPSTSRKSGESVTKSSGNQQKESRPERDASRSTLVRASHDSIQPEACATTRGYVNDIKFMHHVVTHRDEHDPETTGEMEFEKIIVRLRLFLRAESIKRLEQFIDLGGLAYLVKIVTGILDVEWRKRHETRFLLGTLHCIRIILKTEEGANRFYSLGQHQVLFPALARMQFSWGEERRAFFRFDHRAVITEIFYYWIRTVTLDCSNLEDRANQVLAYLQDFPDKETDQHDFVAAMHKQRRYKNWHKEVKDTTTPWRGTPWMYYHKENIIEPRQQEEEPGQPQTFSDQYAPTRRPELISSTVRSHTETLVAHYVAANLDLMNICIVAQSGKSQRIALRQELANCGFEELFGRKLRLASQVNFPCIESALRDWVTAAKADGWPTSHVTALPERSLDESRAGCGVPSKDGPLSQCLLNFDVLEDTPFDL